jgi:transposase
MLPVEERIGWVIRDKRKQCRAVFFLMTVAHHSVMWKYSWFKMLLLVTGVEDLAA